MSRSDTPRVAPPQLPALSGVEASADADGEPYAEALLSWSVAEASAIGAEISDSQLARLPTDRLHSPRLRLSEVEVSAPAVIDWDAARSNWRGVAVSGGSIGVLDASGSQWNNVCLDGVRIGYLNLREANLSDVRLSGCRIGTLDLAAASTTRVALQECVIDDLDVRNRKGEQLDLRGLDVGRLNRLEGAQSLAGAILTEDQASRLGPLLARALRIAVEDR